MGWASQWFLLPSLPTGCSSNPTKDYVRRPCQSFVENICGGRYQKSQKESLHLSVLPSLMPIRTEIIITKILTRKPLSCTLKFICQQETELAEYPIRSTRPNTGWQPPQMHKIPMVKSEAWSWRITPTNQSILSQIITPPNFPILKSKLSAN